MKKRFLSLTLLLSMLVTLLIPARAASSALVTALKLGSPWCVIGTELTQVDTDNASVVPVAENGRTFVPVRFVTENLGLQVAYDGAHQIHVL